MPQASKAKAAAPKAPSGGTSMMAAKRNVDKLVGELGAYGNLE
jgi:hypothetical protein